MPHENRQINGTGCTCTHCGQTLPRDYLILGLRGKQRIIFEAVSKAGQYGLNSDRLFDMLYSEHPDGGPDTGKKVLHVLVRSVNRKLKPFGKYIAAPRGQGGPSNYTLRNA